MLKLAGTRQKKFVILRMLILICVAVLFCQPPERASGATKVDFPSSLERTKKLSAQAATAFANNDVSSALRSLRETADIVNSLEPGEQRTVTGFEIKDTVLAAFEGKQMNEETTRREAVKLALQSLSKDGNTLPDAAPIERFNDSVFLLRLTRICGNGSSLDEAVDYYLWAILLSRDFNAAKTPFEYEDVHHFPENVFKQGRVSGLLRILKEAPEELRSQIACNLPQRLRYAAFLPANNTYLAEYRSGQPKPKQSKSDAMIAPAPAPEGAHISYDRVTTLKIADETELLATEVTDIITRINSQGRCYASPGWDARLRGFVWKSYLAAAAPEAAGRKLDVWLKTIRNIPNPVERAMELRTAIIDMERADIASESVTSLKREAEDLDKLVKPSFPVRAPTDVPEKKQ